MAYPLSPGDPPLQDWEGGALFSLLLILLSIGLSTLYSASSFMAVQDGLADSAYLTRQIQGAIIGALLLLVASQTDYRRWGRLALPLLLLSVASLALVLLPGTEAIAPRLNGARRWISIGPITLQPSEFAKLALLVWTARYLVRRAHLLDRIGRGLLPLLAVWALVLVLIAAEPSVSAAALAGLLVLTLGLVGGVRLFHVFLLGVPAAAPLWIYIISEPYRLRRITAFMDPLANADGSSYQIVQSLTAIGSGGAFGRGFGQSRMKDGFLPEPHNDFASSILGEEWGFFGLTVLTLLYLVVGLLGIRVARRAPDAFGCLLAVGMSLLLVLPAFLHLAINLSLVPPTGVALPFISYGRSSLLVQFMAAGILINIAAAGCRRRELRQHLEQEESALPVRV